MAGPSTMKRVPSGLARLSAVAALAAEAPMDYDAGDSGAAAPPGEDAARQKAARVVQPPPSPQAARHARAPPGALAQHQPHHAPQHRPHTAPPTMVPQMGMAAGAGGPPAQLLGVAAGHPQHIPTTALQMFPTAALQMLPGGGRGQPAPARASLLYGFRAGAARDPMLGMPQPAAASAAGSSPVAATAAAMAAARSSVEAVAPPTDTARGMAAMEFEMLKNIEKRAQKRAANRRSAQLSRRRKKAYIEELKKQNSELRKHEVMLEQITDAVVVFNTMPMWHVVYGNGAFMAALCRAGCGKEEARRICGGTTHSGESADIMLQILDEPSGKAVREAVAEAMVRSGGSGGDKGAGSKGFAGSAPPQEKRAAEEGSERKKEADEGDEPLILSESRRRQELEAVRAARVPFQRRLKVRLKARSAGAAAEEAELDGAVNMAAEPPEVVCSLRFPLPQNVLRVVQAPRRATQDMVAGGKRKLEFGEEAMVKRGKSAADAETDAGYVGDLDGSGRGRDGDADRRSEKSHESNGTSGDSGSERSEQ